MQQVRRAGRVSLLTLSLLSACAAADPLSSGVASSAGHAPSGVFGQFLAGRFAASQSDPNTAAEAFVKGLAADPKDAELRQQAFIAAVLSGRSEAVPLARQLPDNQVASLLLADQDARNGNWAAAEQRFHALPRQGLTQLLQPLLVAWAQAGAGHTDTALATLAPFIEGPRFRGIFALHGAMIADIGGNQTEAARLYAITEHETPQLDLRLGRILASWQARGGHPAAAQHILARLTDSSPEIAITAPALEALSTHRPVARATDGIAETYLALAAALHTQDSREYAMLMLRLALDLRPGLTEARMLAAELLSIDHHEAAALQMLAAVPGNDPLSPVVRMRRAASTQLLGRPDDAMHELDRLAAEYPDSPLPTIQRGDMLRAKQRFAEAITVYTRAIAQIGQPHADDWPVFYNRGIAYEHVGQWHKAEDDFRRALQLAPDQPYVLNYLAYSWTDRGEHLAEARQMLQNAAQRRPNDGAITDSLGWVMLRQGQVADAVRLLERAVELQPEDATINGHLGDAYSAAGRKLEAQYQWRRALTLNPEPEDLAKLEAKLQMPAAATDVSGR